MKSRILILMVVILGSIGIAIAQNKLDSSNVLDYFKIVHSEVLDNEESGIEVEDTKNGYLRIVVGQDKEFEVALFRKKDRTPILVVSEMFCDEGCKWELSAYQLIRNKMVNVTDKIIPKLSAKTDRESLGISEEDRFKFNVNVKYILPRYGRSIRLIEEEMNSVIADFEWKNDRFIVKTSKDIFKPITTVETKDSSPIFQCENRKVDQFKAARVKGRKNERTYFYGVEGEKYSVGIDNTKDEKYRTTNYLITDDEVLVMKTNGSWACAYYESKNGNKTIGLLKLSDLSFIKTQENLNNWLGTWENSNVSWFKINKNNQEGYVTIDGYVRAYFRGDERVATVENVSKSPSLNSLTIPES